MFVNRFKEEYIQFNFGEKHSKDNNFYFENGAFETVDAEILYSMIRYHKPKKIVEIGSGFSTLVSAQAIEMNTKNDPNYTCDFICIDPFPKSWLFDLTHIKMIIESKVELQAFDLFENLGENDILFIDSSHVINAYNDVCFEYLEILPRLKKGVLIHFHDILLPQKYSRSWLNAKYFWNEQYLLQAFLAFNNSFKVIWAGNFMHLNNPEMLTSAFPSYSKFKKHNDPNKRSQGHKSFWIQRIS
jgi:predicted O-methyltransferase YrrM